MGFLSTGAQRFAVGVVIGSGVLAYFKYARQSTREALDDAKHADQVAKFEKRLKAELAYTSGKEWEKAGLLERKEE